MINGSSMNVVETSPAETPRYEDLFPPLLVTNDAMPDLPSSSNNSSFNANQKVKANKSVKTLNNSEVKLPPRVRPGESFGFGKRTSKNSTELVIPSAERRYLESSQEKFQRNEIQRISQKLQVNVDQRIGVDQSLTLLIHGNTESEVFQARQLLINALSIPTSKVVQIPQEYHKFILGRKGQTLMNIEAETGTKVVVPRFDDQTGNTSKIEIFGSRQAIEAATTRILSIYSDQCKRAQVKLQVPRIYLPFVLGPYNKNVEDLKNQYDIKINVPPYNSAEEALTLIGEKDAIGAAHDYLKRILNEASKNCTTLQFNLPRAKHRHVFGSRGSGRAEILAATGVSVEQVNPQAGEGSVGADDLLLRGPQDRLGAALSLVIERGNSIKEAQVACDQWLMKEIIGVQGAALRELIGEFQASVKVDMQSEGSGAHQSQLQEASMILIEGPSREVDVVAGRFRAKVAELRATMQAATIRGVDPHHYKFVVGKGGVNIDKLQRDFGVSINLDSNAGQQNGLAGSEEGSIRIVGPVEGVARAKLEIETIISRVKNEVHKEVNVPQKFHRLLIGAQGKWIREVRSRYPDVLINFPDAALHSDVVGVRGPSQQVDAVLAEIQAAYQQHADLQSLPMDVSSHLHRLLAVERNRELVLGSIEAEAGSCVRVSLVEQQLVVAGPRSEVTVVQQLLSQLEADKQVMTAAAAGAVLVEESMVCRSDLVRMFTGRAGNLYRELREKTGAHLARPKISSSNSNTTLTTLTVFGFTKESVSKAADVVRTHLADLETVEECELAVDPKWLGRLKRASVLTELGSSFPGLQVNFPGSRAGPVGSGAVVVKLSGPRKHLEPAAKRLQQIVADLEAQVTVEVQIPVHYHRVLIGPSGKNVRDLQEVHDVNIRFPRLNRARNSEDPNGALEAYEFSPIYTTTNGSSPAVDHLDEQNDQHCIRISGRPEACEAARLAMLALIPTERSVPLCRDLHCKLIGGKNQAEMNRLQREFSVTIRLPGEEEEEEPHDDDDNGDDGQQQKTRDTITVLGTHAAIDRFQSRLDDELVPKWRKELEDQRLRSFELELRLSVDEMQAVMMRGRRQFVDEIAEKFAVFIQRRKCVQSAVLETGAETEEKCGGDDQQVVEEAEESKPPASNHELLVIRGYQEQVEAAKAALLDRVQYVQSLVRAELNLPHEIHNRLIGLRGRTLAKFIQDHQLEAVNFPPPGAEDADLVVVLGPADKVDPACDALVDLANDFMDKFHDQQQRSNTGGGGAGGGRGFHGPPTNFIMHTTAAGRSGEASVTSARAGGGFYVVGAPWQQQQKTQAADQAVVDDLVADWPTGSPDPANLTDFPSIAGPDN